MTRENNKEVISSTIWVCNGCIAVAYDQDEIDIHSSECECEMTPYAPQSQLTQYEALESKLALAIEALEDIANVDRDYPEQQIARKALTKLKEE